MLNPDTIRLGRALQADSELVVLHKLDKFHDVTWVFGVGHAPHCLIVGTTGGGKTTLIRWMTIVLINKYWQRREEIKITLIDGKGANSYLMFTGQPGIVGIVNKPDPASKEKDPIPDVIRLFHKEVMKRYRDFDKAKKAALYTRTKIRYAKPLPMFLVFDEFLDWILHQKPLLRKEILNILLSIAQTAREVNCHLIIATQAPYAEVSGETGVPGALKRQLKCRIAMTGPLGLDDVEAKMAFGAGHADAGDRIARACRRAGVYGIHRRGVGMVRIGNDEAIFKCPKVADPLHWETSDADRIAAWKMLPRHMISVPSGSSTEEVL